MDFLQPYVHRIVFWLQRYKISLLQTTLLVTTLLVTSLLLTSLLLFCVHSFLLMKSAVVFFSVSSKHHFFPILLLLRIEKNKSLSRPPQQGRRTNRLSLLLYHLARSAHRGVFLVFLIFKRVALLYHLSFFIYHLAKLCFAHINTIQYNKSFSTFYFHN